MPTVATSTAEQLVLWYCRAANISHRVRAPSRKTLAVIDILQHSRCPNVITPIISASTWTEMGVRVLKNLPQVVTQPVVPRHSSDGLYRNCFHQHCIQLAENYQRGTVMFTFSLSHISSSPFQSKHSTISFFLFMKYLPAFKEKISLV